MKTLILYLTFLARCISSSPETLMNQMRAPTLCGLLWQEDFENNVAFSFQTLTEKASGETVDPVLSTSNCIAWPCL
ncbi:hypothetical protein BT69DRAFT_1101427 [Atractiella rhizophila]|nr:hypothetical protein BT69DRAFT_1101427 [Atractiella rhizophila]